MKNRTCFFPLAFLFLLTGCGKKAEVAPAVEVSDSVATVAVSDSAAPAAEVTKLEFLAQDLRLFGLYGRVAACEHRYSQWKASGKDTSKDYAASAKVQVLSFDMEGRLTRLNCIYLVYPEDAPSEAFYKVGEAQLQCCNPQGFVDKPGEGDYARDQKGRIHTLGYFSHRFEVHYGSQGEVKDFIYVPDGTWLICDKPLRRDSLLRVMEAEVVEEEMDCGQPVSKARLTYRYTRTDDHGNWTERVATIKGQTSHVPYAELGKSGAKPVSRPFSASYVETRTIAYYE